MSIGDLRMVETFDYSKLSPAFDKLPKPAKRALINAAVLSPKQLAMHTRAEIAALHGMGPGSFPALEAALKAEGLKFKAG